MGRSNAASQCSRNNSNGSSLYQQRDGNPYSSRSHSQQSLQRRAPTARMIAEQMTNSNALVHGGAPPPMGTKKRAPSVMPTSRQPPAKKVRKSQTEFPLMERGLLPYNHGPDLGVDARLQLVDSNEDQVPMTRTILRRRSKSLNDEPLSPRQSLNVTHLMRAQIEPDPHGFGEQSMNLERPRNVGQNRHRVPRLVPLSLEKPMSEQVVKFPVKEAWRSWENEKDDLFKCLTSSAYGTDVQMPSRLRLAPDGSSRNLRELGYHVEESGLMVFEPAIPQYYNFPALLQLVEESAGRMQGVVKIILPEGVTKPHIIDLDVEVSEEARVSVTQVWLDQNESAKQAGLYRVNNEEAGVLPVSRFRDRIEQKKDYLQEKWDLLGSEDSDVWRENYERNTYDEASMLNSLHNDAPLFCAMDIPGTPENRADLECSDLDLTALPGNTFFESTSINTHDIPNVLFPGITQSTFHLSYRTGPMFILQMGEFASYTMNYHHSGGPRTYIIISPSHHARLETLLRLAVASDPKVPTPAMCSQFASHSKFYIPKETLIRNDIAFTEVTQYEGEMLIIFPFAYYQGFNAGPNITEEITYASERWKTFHRRDFYDPCDKKCGGEKDTFDLGFVGVEDVEMADQGGVAGGEAVEEVVQPVQRPRKGSMNRGPVRF